LVLLVSDLTDLFLLFLALLHDFGFALLEVLDMLRPLLLFVLLINFAELG